MWRASRFCFEAGHPGKLVSTMFARFFFCVLFVFAATKAINPGFRTEITQRGLDYSEVLVSRDLS